MPSLTSTSFLLRGAFVALLAAVALSGPTGFGPGERSAEAAFSAEVKKLLASDGEAGDDFGLSVSISGNVAVVGTNKTGAAYVYERDTGGGANWGEVKILTSTGGHGSFGQKVAVSGDTAIVGAVNDTVTGATYVFERDQGGAGNWGEAKKLTPSEGTCCDNFGRSVAISGDVAIIGERGDQASDTGAAYIFERDEGGTGNWGEVKKLMPSDPGEGDHFGDSVAVAGDTAFVGSRLEDEAGNDAGAVYVFERDEGGAGNWGEVTKLIGSDTDANDEFGTSVAVSADTLVVGAKFADLGFPPPGAAYVFERDQGGAGNWGEVKKLTASDPDWLDRFGVSVSVDGDTIVVGAAEEDEAAVNAGAVYVYKRDQGGAGNWGEFQKLAASDAATGDFFGQSVSVSGAHTLVGAPFEDTAGSLAGAAYVFETGGPDDTDGDGCTDKAEGGPDASLGGQRNKNSFWDFYDVWTHPPGDPIGWERNAVINIFDINATGMRFGPGPVLSKEDAIAEALAAPTDGTGYHAAYDRGPIIGANDWDRGPPDGSINIVDDILGVAAQFGHNCG